MKLGLGDCRRKAVERRELYRWVEQAERENRREKAEPGREAMSDLA